MTPTSNLISHIMMKMRMQEMRMVRLGLWTRKMVGMLIATWGRGKDIMVMIMMRVVRAAVATRMMKK